MAQALSPAHDKIDPLHGASMTRVLGYNPGQIFRQESSSEWIGEK